MMDIGKKRIQETELNNKKRNQKIAKLILQEFYNMTGLKFKSTDLKIPLEILINVRSQHIYTSPDTTLFSQLLEKYHYNIKMEIIEAINNLGNLKDPNKNEELIKTLLNSPIIQDISFNGIDTFTIWSEQYGKFVFELATYYFRTNKQVTDYIQTNPLQQNCHKNTYGMSKIFDDFYAITSLCQHYFQGHFYHSYTFDHERKTIIDLCHNVVMNKSQYDCLFQPQEISVIINNQVERELALTLQKTSQKKDRCQLLKIALYKQYLNSIGYHGDLESAPYAKSKIRQLLKK